MFSTCPSSHLMRLGGICSSGRSGPSRRGPIKKGLAASTASPSIHPHTSSTMLLFGDGHREVVDDRNFRATGHVGTVGGATRRHEVVGLRVIRVAVGHGGQRDGLTGSRIQLLVRN